MLYRAARAILPPVRVSLAALIALLALAACREEKRDSAGPAPPPASRQQSARDAAAASLRDRLNGRETQLRGVQVFTQALAETVAVCGRSSAGAGDPYIPYVAVVAFEGEAARVTGFTLGATGPEATRVFLELVDRCFDGGGPVTNRPMARSYPPLPAIPGAGPGEVAAAVPPMPAPAPAAPQPAPAGVQILAGPSAPAALPASRQTVTTWARTGANLRNGPIGGEVIGVVPASTTLEVVGEAPGGWYQVAQGGVAIGWLHASVLEAPLR